MPEAMVGVIAAALVGRRHPGRVVPSATTVGATAEVAAQEAGVDACLRTRPVRTARRVITGPPRRPAVALLEGGPLVARERTT